MRLIEREELDICEVSLATVTNDYLYHVRSVQLDPHEINWFLDIASKLILCKSRALLPDEADTYNDEIEELTEQLKTLKALQEAASAIKEGSKNPLLTRPQKMPTNDEIETYTNLSDQTLALAYQALLDRSQEAPTQEFRFKRQSPRELKARFLRTFRDSSQLTIESIPTLTQNPYETVVFFILILELIKDKRAQMIPKAPELTVELI